MSAGALLKWDLPLLDRVLTRQPVKRAKRSSRLVLISCSATKRPDGARMPAIERYDGPLWQTLRTADPNGTLAQVAFLSAHYGFRSASTPIADYDARLTRDLADAMIAGGMTTRWPRPRLASMPDTVGAHPGVEIAGLYHAAGEPLRDIALVGGALYLEVMRAFLVGFREMGCIAADATVTEINGPIGFMRRDLRRWLHSDPTRPQTR
ncbi:hypothetical protein [Aureimonas ureilytica]|uniref:hypothetical protein n=1 Tax=Aureimonas ureilytica TaxID=401562 RepID=UPI00037E93F9|nr:hypothetical protein [Aureimonas ureilytica]